jgi:hypothetical protein
VIGKAKTLSLINTENTDLKGNRKDLPRIKADERGSGKRSPKSPTSRVIAVIGKAKPLKRSGKRNGAILKGADIERINPYFTLPFRRQGESR